MQPLLRTINRYISHSCVRFAYDLPTQLLFRIICVQSATAAVVIYDLPMHPLLRTICQSSRFRMLFVYDPPMQVLVRTVCVRSVAVAIVLSYFHVSHPSSSSIFSHPSFLIHLQAASRPNNHQPKHAEAHYSPSNEGPAVAAGALRSLSA